MRRRAWLWIAVPAAAWLAVMLLGLAMRADPAPWLGAGLVAGVTGAWWLLFSRAPQVASHDWGVRARFKLRGGGDPDLRQLRRDLADGPDEAAYRDWLHPALVQVVDDRLRLRYGIDRRRHPDRARAALGDRLAEFIAERPSGSPARSSDYLADILTRIEGL